MRLPTKVTKGPSSRAAGIAMAYKVIERSQACWRAANVPHLVASSVPRGVLHKGKLLECLIDFTLTEPIEPTETEVA